MKKKFNFKDYEALVEMKKCGKIVPPDENYFKLLSYKTSVSEQLIYNRKEQYYSIIEKYLNKNLTLLEFRTQFLNIEEEDIEKGSVIFENRQELEAFYFTEDLQKFYKLIGQLFDLCEDYYFMEPMPETEFYACVKKYYRPLQENFPFKNSSTNI